jgi:hypothetical protein
MFPVHILTALCSIKHRDIFTFGLKSLDTGYAAPVSYALCLLDGLDCAFGLLFQAHWCIVNRGARFSVGWLTVLLQPTTQRSLAVSLSLSLST